MNYYSYECLLCDALYLEFERNLHKIKIVHKERRCNVITCFEFFVNFVITSDSHWQDVFFSSENVYNFTLFKVHHKFPLIEELTWDKLVHIDCQVYHDDIMFSVEYTYINVNQLNTSVFLLKFSTFWMTRTVTKSVLKGSCTWKDVPIHMMARKSAIQNKVDLINVMRCYLFKWWRFKCFI